MQVREKTHHIDVHIDGDGAALVAAAVRQYYPDAVFVDEEADSVRWNDTALARDIRAGKTPGKLLRAYRERAGLTVTALAEMVGTRYPNIVAMENDRRVVGLAMARKLGAVLGVDHLRFL